MKPQSAMVLLYTQSGVLGVRRERFFIINSKAAAGPSPPAWPVLGVQMSITKWVI